MIKKIAIGVFAVAFLYLAVQIGLGLRTHAQLNDAPGGYVFGNPEGDLNVVEFVSYTCPYCRDIHPVIMNAVKRDGNVRYISRPLSSPDLPDAEMVYAAGKQDAYAQTYEALMIDPRLGAEGGLMGIAETLGLDTEKLQADMESADIKKMAQSNRNLFLNIGATHTPTFIIGGKLFYTPSGAMPTEEDFLTMFAEARQ